jgi:hypothetical protein
VLLHAYLPEATQRLLEALGHTELAIEAARFGAPGGARIGDLGQLFPRVEPPDAAAA